MTAQQQTPYLADAKTRRANNRIGCLHHHAFMVKDMEETRHFYEDILGLPLIGTWVERVNPVTGQPDNYVHTFFELADGSCLAFFQFKSPESSREASINKFENSNPFGHHIALTVDGKDAVLEELKDLYAAGKHWQDRAMALKAIGDIQSPQGLAFLKGEQQTLQNLRSQEAGWSKQILALYLD